MAKFFVDLPLRSVGSITAPGLASEGTLQALLDEAKLKANLDETQPVSILAPVIAALQFLKNGIATLVSYDTSNPANSDAIPVNIVTVNGEAISTTVDLSGAQINVKLTDRGTSPDAVLLGDGTNYAGVNANNEVKTHDAETLAKLGDIDIKTPALGQALAADSVPVVLTAAQLLALTPPAPIAGFATEATLASLAGIDFATEAKQDTQITALGNIGGELETQTERLNLLATELTLLALSGKLPTSLGAKLAAASLSITPATDAEFTVIQKAPTVTGTDDSQDVNETVGVTFNKPIGAKNMVVFNNGGAIANRVRIGQAPDWAMGLGALLGVGNSTALLPASSFKAVAEDVSSNANVSVLWFY